MQTISDYKKWYAEHYDGSVPGEKCIEAFKKANGIKDELPVEPVPEEFWRTMDGGSEIDG